MSKFFTVQIPTSVYLKVFVEREFGSPVPINNHSLLGVFLIGTLQKTNPITRFSWVQKNLRFQHFTEKIVCIAPISLMKDFGFSVTEDQVIQINRFFEQYFDRELYYYVKHRVNSNERYSGYKEAIQSFATHYGLVLEEHITYEALKKMEYRYRTKVNKEIISQVCPLPPQQRILFT
jgi:hypothetical protein